MTQFACALAGIILVNVNPAYRATELHYAAKLVGLRGLVLQTHMKGSEYYTILQDAGNIPTLLHVIEVGNNVTRKGSVSFNNLIQHRDPSSIVLHLDGSLLATDACNIQFTSGTTGHPKVVNSIS